MSDGDYEYECMRCDLLGLPRPSRENFTRPQTEHDSSQDPDEENQDNEVNTDQDQDTDLKDEHLKTTSGGLDELNNILSLTQKKLNKFKVVCGSFTNLLRLKVSGGGDGSTSGTSSRGSLSSDTEGQRETEGEMENATSPAGAAGGQKPHELDVSSKVDSQVDKLDSLLMKAEKAHISMTSQNKQMKSFLK